MSGIVSDPSTLTKDKLKRELAKFDVEIPSPDARKSVYVELYRKHVLSRTSEFSADEEGSPKLRKKKSKKPSKKMATTAGVDVMGLSDEELLEMLKSFGVEMGPVLPSTRKVYQKKLQKLLSSAGEPAPISDSQDTADTVDIDEIDFSADSDPEPEPPKVLPQPENVRRRQTRSSPPRPPPSPSRSARVKPPPSPPRQRSEVIAPTPRTPPKLPQDARPIPPSRTLHQTQTVTKPSGKTEQKKKGWMSVWLQIALVLLVAIVIFFVVQNMEPASKDPLKGLARDIP